MGLKGDKPGLRKRGRPKKEDSKAPKRRLGIVAAITAKHEEFIERFMVRQNATRAYQDVYPEANYRTASTEGSRMARDPRIAPIIKGLQAKIRAGIRATANRVIEETSALAFSSLPDALDEHGNLIAPNRLPRNVGVAIKKIKRREIVAPPNEEGVREVVGHTIEYEMHDKVGALKLLGQHFGVFKEEISIAPGGAWLDELKAARERALKETA